MLEFDPARTTFGSGPWNSTTTTSSSKRGVGGPLHGTLRLQRDAGGGDVVGRQLQELCEPLGGGEAVLATEDLPIAVQGDGKGRITVTGELDTYKGWGEGERAC